MTLAKARQVIMEVGGKPYSWLEAWGISAIKEAIQTIYNRKSATRADLLSAKEIEYRLYRKW